MIQTASAALDFRSLGLDPLWFSIPLPFTDWSIPIRWYAMAYLFGVMLSWRFLLCMLSKPGAPTTRAQVNALPS